MTKFQAYSPVLVILYLHECQTSDSLLHGLVGVKDQSNYGDTRFPF